MAKKNAGGGDRKKAPKSGALMLRIPPELHGDLADTAKGLGLDTTGLLRLMIRRCLPHYQLEARLIGEQGKEAADLLETWRRRNPGRPIREFWDDYYRHQLVKWTTDVVNLELDPRFRLAEVSGGGVQDLFSTQQDPRKEDKP
jgi:hypothetical protein